MQVRGNGAWCAVRTAVLHRGAPGVVGRLPAGLADASGLRSLAALVAARRSLLRVRTSRPHRAAPAQRWLASSAAPTPTPTQAPPSLDKEKDESHEPTASAEGAATAAATVLAPAPGGGSPSDEDSDRIDRRVFPIAGSAFLMGTAIGVVLPIMPVFARSLGLSTAEFGLVVSVMGGTRLLFNIPAAYIADRYGRRPLLFGGPLVSSVGMLATATADSMQALMAYRFLAGAGGSLQMAGAQTYLSDISKPSNRARTMAPMQIAFGSGAAMGPALGGFMADSYGLALPFVFVGSAMALASLNNYMMCPETRPAALLQRHASGGGGGGGDGTADTSMRGEFRRTLEGWRTVSRDKDIRAVVACHTAYWMCMSGTQMTLMPILATERFAMSPSSLGGVFVLVSAIGIVGAQPSAWFADKFGRKKALVPASAMLATSLFLVPHASTKEEFLALMTLWACGSTALGTAPTAYTADITSAENRATALALLRSGGDFGMFVGSLCMGAIAHFADITTAYTTAGLLLSCAGLNFAFRARDVVPGKNDPPTPPTPPPTPPSPPTSPPSAAPVR